MLLTLIDTFAKCTFLSFATHTFSQAVTALIENQNFGQETAEISQKTKMFQNQGP